MAALTAGLATTATWQGTGTQEDFMARDMCLLVDENDTIVGTASKRDAHVFSEAQPRGLLHRAFSVFLFDGDGRLLLQQRASSKITFPDVWTNTCCSHQLSGQTPDEVDSPESVAAGRAPGSVAAAIRKLGHELGVPPEQLPPGAFRFLTRLHYCAADAGTYGAGAPWGEHELDYLLAIRVPGPLTLRPHPDEVRATAWVTQPELRALMAPDSGRKWSPWFRLIAAHLLPAWWADLAGTLGGRHDDWGSIHRLECDAGVSSGCRVR